MAKKLDHRFWAKYFKVYDVLNMVIPYQELLDTIVKEAKIKKGDLVLDAGCGTGNLSMKCKAAGAKVIGIDYCIEALDRYKQKDPDAEMFVHDLTKPLPFPDNYFDAVVCNNVIYALSKKDRLLAVTEFFRVTKLGGKIVLSNALKDNKPIMVYFDTLRREKAKNGVLKTVFLVLRMLTPTISILSYNRKIVKANKTGNYNFFVNNEQKELLAGVGYNKVSEDIYIYSGQAVLNYGEKRA